ncbi:MAG: PaaI family thioesterase [Bdellovibrio sp.]|nr:PaaI family thioesterase [Bdellovibrio sp.]
MLKDTLFLRSFSLFKVPMLFFIGPRVIELTETTTVIEIPLNYRTKNHLGAMYFGVLAAGADCAGGVAAMKTIYEFGQPVSLVFKNFKADFLKRAHDNVQFVCKQGIEVKELVQKAIDSKERQELSLNIDAFCPAKFKEEPVARFVLTLSVKLK